jgi:putative ABC transport system permease protein
VASVAGELLELVELETGVVSMVSGWADDSSLWAIQSMSDGSRPGPQDPDGVVLGQTIAELSGKRVGDTFEISDHAFRVSGIFSARDLRSARSIVVRLASLQELMGKRGEVTMFNIRLVHPDNAAQSSAIQDRLARGFPNLRFTRTETAADNDMVFLLLRSLAWGISLIGLITALVLILNTLLMSVLERKTEIGVLAAVGWQTGRIVAMVVSEGVLLSTMGGILGVGLGQVALQWLARMPKILGVESPQFTWETAAEIGTATLLLSILGSAYPAWRAARLNAVDALRAE